MGAVAARVTGAVAGGLDWAEARLDDVRDRLTPGQRWTSALALVLAVLVLLFGIPNRVVVTEGPAVTSRPRPVQGTAAPSSPAAAIDYGPGETGFEVLTPELPTFTEVPVTLAEPDFGLPALPEPPPRVVALVRSDSPSRVPGREDSAIAKVFVERSGFPVTTIALDPADAGLCAKVAAAGNVVMASRGVDAKLRSCLVAAGAAVVAFDELGDLSPASPGDGQVVSTRRGIDLALIDLGMWGLDSGALRGRVGVVSTATARPYLDPAVSTLAAQGVDVTATAWVTDPSSPAEVSDAVRAFAAKGVQVVVFAAPVELQRRWVAQQTVIGQVRYVVADAFDAIAADEGYPPVFEGALAYSSLRVPWFKRDRGETPAQAFCRQQWEQVAAPATTLGAEETVRVFAWCEHVALVTAVLRAVDAGKNLSEAIRTQLVVSPLTSDLAPLPAGGYGPAEDAVLVWRSSCACWKENRAFAPRG